MISKLPNVTTSIFTVMSKMASDYNALNLSQGFPNFKSDPFLIDLVNKAMEEGYNQYAPMSGYLELREIIPIIKNCKISICNDSSFSHLSAALGIQTIVLMSDTPLLYGSYSPRMHPIIPDGESSVTHDTKGKEKINPKKILEKLNDILN